VATPVITFRSDHTANPIHTGDIVNHRCGSAVDDDLERIEDTSVDAGTLQRRQCGPCSRRAVQRVRPGRADLNMERRNQQYPEAGERHERGGPAVVHDNGCPALPAVSVVEVATPVPWPVDLRAD